MASWVGAVEVGGLAEQSKGGAGGPAQDLGPGEVEAESCVPPGVAPAMPVSVTGIGLSLVG